VQQVFNLLRGLARQYHGAIPHITSRVPLPTFLQARSFLMLEEHRADQSTRQQAAHALMAARSPPPPTYGSGNESGSSSNSNRNRRGKNKGKDKEKGKAPASSPPASPAPPAPAARTTAHPAPAPGANSWTGLVQAWPVNWRVPGAGVLGPRPGIPPQHALMAAPPQATMAPYGYGYPYIYGSPGAGPSSPPAPQYGSPGASSSTAPAPQPWDMGPLHAALHGSATPPAPPPNSTSDWYLDTGASSHMSSGSGNLTSIRPSHSRSQIVVGNGAFLPITHTGTGSLITTTSPLKLRNVLLSPSLVKNLLSVRQLTRDNHVSVEFDASGFSVKDIRTRAVILRCDSDGDLYPVSGGSTAAPRPHFAGVASAKLWHQRLGHPSSVLHSSLSEFQFSKSSSHTCHACRLGKNVRLPFVSSTSSS
jgi:hypothetical protein